MHCPAAVQVLLGRSEKATEAEWPGAGALGPDLMLVQARWSHCSPAGLLQSKGMSDYYLLSLGSRHLPLGCLLSFAFLWTSWTAKAPVMPCSFWSHFPRDPFQQFKQLPSPRGSQIPEQEEDLVRQGFPVEQPSSCDQSKATNYWDNAIITASQTASPSNEIRKQLLQKKAGARSSNFSPIPGQNKEQGWLFFRAQPRNFSSTLPPWQKRSPALAPYPSWHHLDLPNVLSSSEGFWAKHAVNKHGATTLFRHLQIRRKKPHKCLRTWFPKVRQRSFCWNGRHVSFPGKEALPPCFASSDQCPRGRTCCAWEQHTLLSALELSSTVGRKTAQGSSILNSGRFLFQPG